MNLKDQIDTLQSQMLDLHKQETDIDEIRRRFLEIEDLIDDIDRRKKQIEILRQRFEDLRQSMNNSVQAIEKIEHDAESKMRKLTDFVSAVNVPENGNGSIQKALPGVGDKKQLVMTLGEMGWSPEEISERINLDLATIQTILQTFNH